MAPHFSASITSQLNNVGDRVGKEKKTRTIASSTFVVRPGPAPPPFLGRGQSLGESQERRPQARGCGGPPRQEEKEEAASPSAHPPTHTPVPTSGPRDPANRMEVGAGRTGPELKQWPWISLASWGRGLYLKKDPVNLG